MTNAPSVTRRSLSDFRFRKTDRLLKSADFRKVYDKGVRFSCPYFVAFLLKHDLRTEGPRIGFTIPRAIGKSVIRNRIRRRLRELIRLSLSSFDPTWDIVLNPRRSSYQASREGLARELERLIQRCRG